MAAATAQWHFIVAATTRRAFGCRSSNTTTTQWLFIVAAATRGPFVAAIAIFHTTLAISTHWCDSNNRTHLVVVIITSDCHSNTKTTPGKKFILCQRNTNSKVDVNYSGHTFFPGEVACEPLEQSPSWGNLRHVPTAFLSSDLDRGENPVQGCRFRECV